jgi:hypothetical protein
MPTIAMLSNSALVIVQAVRAPIILICGPVVRSGALRSLALGALACCIFACGSAAPVANSPVATGPQYAGPLTATIDYGGDHHVRLDPPTETPALQWTSAVSACSACGLPAVATTKPPVVELASYSDDQYMVEGSSSPIYQNVLAYVVMWRGVQCVDYGPPNQPTPSPNQADKGCDDFYLVDATTGQELHLSYQFPAS